MSVVLEFCSLQRGLVERFLMDVRPNDLERFSDVERAGTLLIGNQRWNYARHGSGISFERSGMIVDAHVGLSSFPDAIDGWRLFQYLESIEVATLVFCGESVVADDEKALERLLERMEQEGILKAVHLQMPIRLFLPAEKLYANEVPVPK